GARWGSDLIGNARPLHRPIDELVGLRRLARRDDAVVMRGELADRIRGGRVVSARESAQTDEFVYRTMKRPRVPY
ncbi:MAG TPA: hypothetical protein VE444_09310, partial [Gaiellaceae bacterium]|nr:hypothetical protein [Gaiellaceae bacterium]